MAWNKSPQAKTLQFAEMLFPDHKVEVQGSRKVRGGGYKSPYTSCLLVDGKVCATAQEYTWRIAYKTLQIVISRLSLA